MKKLLSLLLVFAMLTGCKNTSTKTDLKIETQMADMSGYTELKDANPAFEEVTSKESIRIFKEGGTGIVYYGRVSCPWCQRAIPVLDKALKEANLNAYYIDVQKKIDMSDYEELVTYIESTFPLGEDGKPAFQIPLVIAVKDGKITQSHLSLVEGFQLTSEDAQMNEEQTAELLGIYEKMIQSIK